MDETFCDNSSRVLTVNYFHKRFHFKCLIGSEYPLHQTLLRYLKLKRTQLNICGGSFLLKQLKAFSCQLFLQKKLHHRCLMNSSEKTLYRRFGKCLELAQNGNSKFGEDALNKKL